MPAAAIPPASRAPSRRAGRRRVVGTAAERRDARRGALRCSLGRTATRRSVGASWPRRAPMHLPVSIAGRVAPRPRSRGSGSLGIETLRDPFVTGRPARRSRHAERSASQSSAVTRVTSTDVIRHGTGSPGQQPRSPIGTRPSGRRLASATRGHSISPGVETTPRDHFRPAPAARFGAALNLLRELPRTRCTADRHLPENRAIGSCVPTCVWRMR
jgi:hypothetical protein